eukprot:6334175-Prymnesium_polylepis.1
MRLARLLAHTDKGRLVEVAVELGVALRQLLDHLHHAIDLLRRREKDVVGALVQHRIKRDQVGC